MKRMAFTMQLKSGFAEEYKKRHDKIWPEVVELLKKEGISDYAIFLNEATNTLFAVQHLSGSSSQDLGSNPVIKKWWNYMADIMETNDDNSPVTIPLQEVFYLP